MKQTTDKEKARACQKTPQAQPVIDDEPEYRRLVNEAKCLQPSAHRWQAQIDDLCEQRNEYKHHAEKLAECLRDATRIIDHNHPKWNMLFDALGAYKEAAQ